MTAQMKVNQGIDKEPGFDIPDPLSLPSLKGKVSDEEWKLRCDLAATYRLASIYGMTCANRLPEGTGFTCFDELG